MAEDRDQGTDGDRSSVERLLERTLVDESGLGKPLSHRAATTQRSVEAYLKAGVRPRWMERVVEVDRGIAAEKRRLERAYRALRRECAGDRAAFAPPNAWYPGARRLPMNPRTGDYGPGGGRPYRRPVLGPEWALEQFPASGPGER